MGFMRQQFTGRLTDQSNDTPEEAVRPFDVSATGAFSAKAADCSSSKSTKPPRHAARSILCELVGFGASQDAYSISEPDPSGVAYAAAVTKSLADAGLSPQDVTCLIPCATGHPLHDKAELAGLQKAFGPALAEVPVGLPKSQTGYLEAGNALDCVTAVMSVAHGMVPPAINTTNVIAGQCLNLAKTARPQDVEVAVSTVWSIGGQNASLVFKKV